MSSRQDYKEHHDNVNVQFVINLAAKDVEKAEEQGLTEFFKLTSKINTSSMIIFDFEAKIKKYNSPEYGNRLGLAHDDLISDATPTCR